MLHSNKYRKYIYMLLGAALLLPLVFMVGATYQEFLQVKRESQLESPELAKLRSDAETVWLKNQTTYIRGIAKLKAISNDDPQSTVRELQAFFDAGTSFALLGYAEQDGRSIVEYNGTNDRNIADKLFFSEAMAGREYIGEALPADWQLDKAATVIAVPVLAQGEVAGVMYGIIPKDTSEAAAIELIPPIVRELETDRWFAWVGGVYLLEVIPLLLAVYFVRRGSKSAAVQQESPLAFPQKRPLNKRQTLRRGYHELATAEQETVQKTMENDKTAKDTDKAGIQAAIAAVREHQQEQSKPEPTLAATPAAVIDRVLATAAYKAARQQSGLRQEPSADPEGDDLVRRTTQQDVDKIQAEVKPPAQKSALTNSQAAKPPLTPEPIDQPVAGKTETDDFTGLLTKAGFENIMAARQGQPNDAIIALSIDGMKVINDYLGEKAGDTVILAAAEIVKAVGREDCLAARTDGDQFVLLLPGFAAEIEDIKKDIKYYTDLHNVRQAGLPLSITVGAAAVERGANLREAWHKAKRDMEKHKNSNRVKAREFIMWSIKRAKGRS